LIIKTEQYAFKLLVDRFWHSGLRMDPYFENERAAFFVVLGVVMDSWCDAVNSLLTYDVHVK